MRCYRTRPAAAAFCSLKKLCKSECAKNPDGSASVRALCGFLKNGERNLQAILSLPTSITSVHLLHAGGSKCRLVFVGSDVTTPSQPAPFTQNSQTAPRSGSPGAVDRANTIPINPRGSTQSDTTLPNQPAPFNAENQTTSRSAAVRPTNASGVQSGAPASNYMSSMASERVAREDRN